MTSFCKPVLLLFAASFAGMMAVHAQVCQGSLGDPLVNITFGSGPNPGSPLTAAATGYQYIAADCPNDGYYTVRSSTANCFDNSWHSLTTDHTGNPNGYFMLVNASFQPSAFYVDTVRGLCAGTTYEFAAWIANVLKASACGFGGIQPNLSFSIEKTDGTVLQSYNTGSIPNLSSVAWRQYGFYFATPPGVFDIVLRMVNKSPGGCGNDIALDDITFRPCGPLVTAQIVGSNAMEATVCEGTARTFTLGGSLSAGFVNPELRWQQSINGNGWTDIIGSPSNPSYMVNITAATVPGVYAFRLSASEVDNIGSLKCRVSSQPITITVIPKTVATVAGNSPVCEKDTLKLSADGGTSYQWTGPNAFTAFTAAVSIPDAQAIHSGKYYVVIVKDVCPPYLDSIIATVNTNPVATTSFTETSICEGDHVQLAGNGGGTYQWIPATGLSSVTIPNPVAHPVDTTVYKMIVTNQFGCHDTTAVTVNVIEKPRANAGPDQYIVAGKSVQLQGLATGQDISYSWSPALYIDNPLTLQPVVTPPLDRDYVLTVVSNLGCGTAADNVHVYVYPDVYVPNAFTPDNDGLNDTWFIPALRAYSSFTVSVYNRYGQLVFYTKDHVTPWDGRYRGMLQPSGAYVYVVDIKEEKRVLKGTLVIIR